MRTYIFVTWMAVMLINGCLCFSISGSMDAEYVAVDMGGKKSSSKSDECFFKVALKGCDTETLVEVLYVNDDQNKSFTVSAKETQACLLARCTSANEKLFLSTDIEIGGNAIEATPEELKEGTTKEIYATESLCNSAKGIASTVQCVDRNKGQENGKKRTELEEFDDEMSYEHDVSDLPFGEMQGDKNSVPLQDNLGASVEELKSIDGQPIKTAKIQYNNWYRGCLNVQCGNRRALFFVKSHHSNCYEDRVFHFYCKTATIYNFNHCYWTGYQNAFDGPLFAHCGANYIMNGIYSRYSGHHRDRQFSLLCCRAPRYLTRSCYMTNYLNGWDGYLQYGVGGWRYFTGLYSFHDNGREDRLFRISSCDYVRY